ncbi:MAG: DNA-processing protein DprA [Gallionellaceae bacterium]|jgi:DNA processing protein
MSLDSSLAAWLTLSQISGLGNETMRRLLQAFGSPEAVFLAPLSELTRIVKAPIASAIAQGVEQDNLVVFDEWLNDPLNHILTIADSEYPQALLNITDPPYVIFVKGRLDLLNVPALAIVGSRNATPQGLRNGEAFAQAASESGLCIISGMAHGVDAAAHIGGLRGKGSSIAIVGTGLDKVYPSSNRELAHQLAQHGAIISEFPLGTPPLPANFPRRNRIISGLSMGCLVVEASLQSGSLITARMALEQGREVFAIPGSIHSPQSKGCHALIKQGAKLVESAQDILEELGAQYFTKAAIVTPLEHAIFDHLSFDAIDLDTLAQRSGLTIAALSAILLQLEMQGQVATLPGGLYQRIV